MSRESRTARLNNGLRMPRLGLGVWQVKNEKTAEVVKWALASGYRQIDTARVYGNEEGVGRGIAESGVDRKDIWVTTKLGVGDIRRAEEAFWQSLARLGMDYVDLYLVHWPMWGWKEAWKGLERIYKSGRARAIGVSNFDRGHLEEMEKFARVMPAVDQVEISPFLQRRELREYCREREIVVEAYSPLTHGKRLHDATIEQTAKKYKKTPAQIMIRWGLQRGIIMIPKSEKREHVESNAEVWDFELEEADMAKLEALDKNESEFPLWSRG